MKPRWLERSLVSGPYYTICLTDADFQKELKRLALKEPVSFVKNEHSNATTHFMVNEDGNRCAIVCMRDWETRSGVEIAGLLVHEAVHIFQEWCSDKGETDPSSEFEAYSIQWLSQQLMWEFARQTTKH